MHRQWILLIVLLAAAWPLRVAIARERVSRRYIDTTHADALRPGEFVGTLGLSGFRAIAVDMLWLQTGGLQENHEWTELLAVTDMLGKLQPYNEEIWNFTAWNMAFNISLEQNTIEESWDWIQRGLETMDRGLNRNRNASKLYRQSAYQLLGTKIVNDDLELRRYYTDRYRRAYGRHPMDAALESMAHAIELERIKQERGLSNTLRQCLWYQCILLHRYQRCLLDECREFRRGSPERRALLTRTETLRTELELALQRRNDAERARFGQDREALALDPWLRELARIAAIADLRLQFNRADGPQKEALRQSMERQAADVLFNHDTLDFIVWSRQTAWQSRCLQLGEAAGSSAPVSLADPIDGMILAMRTAQDSQFSDTAYRDQLNEVTRRLREFDATLAPPADGSLTTTLVNDMKADLEWLQIHALAAQTEAAITTVLGIASAGPELPDRAAILEHWLTQTTRFQQAAEQWKEILKPHSAQHQQLALIDTLLQQASAQFSELKSNKGN